MTMNNVEKMLRALLRKDNLIRWVGGYVYGRTSNDDPFIILYAPQEYLKEKVVRVYENDFKKLPDFVDTAVPASITNDGNPNKDKARRAGIYIECPLFEILTYLGKETQMGPEIRFDDVLRVTSSTKHYAQVQSTQQPEPQTAVSLPPPPPQPQQQNDTLTAEEMWKLKAASELDPFMFDTAIAKVRPWLQDATTAGQFREALFPGGYDVRYGRGFVAAMVAYADMRSNGKDHNQAKPKAYDAFRQAMKLRQIPQSLLTKQPAYAEGNH